MNTNKLNTNKLTKLTFFWDKECNPLIYGVGALYYTVRHLSSGKQIKKRLLPLANINQDSHA